MPMSLLGAVSLAPSISIRAVPPMLTSPPPPPAAGPVPAAEAAAAEEEEVVEAVGPPGWLAPLAQGLASADPNSRLTVCTRLPRALAPGMACMAQEWH